MSHPSTAPIRLAIVNDYEVVVAGVTAMLAPYSHLVRVVELDSRSLVTGSVDIVLYDTFGQLLGDRSHLQDLVAQSRSKVVVFSWTVHDEDLELALADGAAGYLSKGLSAAEIVTALEAIHAGTPLPTRDLGRRAARDDRDVPGDWPGRAEGLTLRESEVLVYITQGLSNLEIADACYLGINTVKTYIRTAYRKIGVTSRSQAVRYGMTHGFEPARTSAVKAERAR